MSNIAHKVKSTLSHGSHENSQSDAAYDSNNYDSTRSSNHGPHDNNIANSADPRVDSDRSKYNTSSYGSEPRASGANNTLESGRSSNYGPHDSNIANAADPRVDSDRSNTYNTTSSHHGSTGLGGSGVNSNLHSTGSSNYGPHDSNVANTADPRVDSDRSSHGYNSTSTGLGGSTLGGAGAAGLGGATAGHSLNSTGSSNYGPHDSSLANTADPRVDSDRSSHGYNSTSTGLGGSTLGGAGAAGLGGAAAGHSLNSTGSSNYGPHDSNVANAADPRVDSDRSNNAYGTTGTTGTGRSSLGTSQTNPLNTHGGYSSGINNSTGHTGSSTAAPAAAAAGATGLAGASHHSSTSHLQPTTKHRTSLDNSRHTSSVKHTTPRGSVSNATQVPPTNSTASGPASRTAGPHENNLANKMDPRVDSDNSRFQNDVHRDSLLGGNEIPMAGSSANTTTKTFEQAQETAGVSPGGVGSTGGNHNHSSNAGPHGTAGNKLDPRVDSDLDGSANAGSSYNRSSNAGPHGTAGNKLDPRVDSDLDGSANAGSSYNRSSNAGPHGTSGNKLDPRVDSDLDGSATAGTQRV